MSCIKELKHLKISLNDIKSATNDFSSENFIGLGGFGKVYKGELSNSEGRMTVAVKRLDPDRTYGQGQREFLMEIVMLSRYQHKNIVSLLGFCDDNDEKILVYEYMFHGSLEKYLRSTSLTWCQRLKICCGAARGLLYLHDPDGGQQRVIHRDVKSSNILFDENFEAKISDFGLSKIGPANQQFTFLVSNAVGTIGYCDPMYVETGILTKESDVYSFGVVLFEVLCGRLCIENYNDDRRFLTRLAKQSYEGNKLDDIIDDNMKEQMEPSSLAAFSAIAYRCLRKDRDERPTMIEVVIELETALDFQIVNESLEVYCPVVKIPTTSKLSCLSWNKDAKYHLAVSDHGGIITVWDVDTQQVVMEYKEHEKRAWSVDFSYMEPSMLVSGGDDCKVGCADRCSYYYDLRNTSHPLHIFAGHRKSVSYVKFLSNDELATASIDSTLRLWDLKQNLPVRTFKGHSNVRNFVGFSVTNDFMACGSETNEVFAYHKTISKPLAWQQLDTTADDEKSSFVSAVCWKSDSPTPTLIAANSQGTVRVLVLET